jgi:hypothetical protein
VRSARIRLERGAERGNWIPWAHVGADAVAGPAAAAGLEVDSTWECDGRSFAALAARPAPRLGLAS